MSSIKRSDLKYNFLKNIIIRVDVQGVFEPEMEELLTKIKSYLKDKGFSRYGRKQENKIEINVAGNESHPTTLKKVKNYDIHSFANDDAGYVLDVSSRFICLNVNSTCYLPFEHYSSIVLGIVKIYSENIDFFSTTRIGLRKINICMVKNKNSISKYFAPTYFGHFNTINKRDILFSNRQDVFHISNNKVNLNYKIEKGHNGEELLYKITLDTDIYVDDASEISKIADYSKKFDEMNDLIFDIYIESLTNEFQRVLLGETEPFFDDLIGVEQNEQ